MHCLVCFKSRISIHLNRDVCILLTSSEGHRTCSRIKVAARGRSAARHSLIVNNHVSFCSLVQAQSVDKVRLTGVALVNRASRGCKCVSGGSGWSESSVYCRLAGCDGRITRSYRSRDRPGISSLGRNCVVSRNFNSVVEQCRRRSK